MNTLQMAWGQASRLQKATIVVAVLVTIGALASLGSDRSLTGPHASASATPAATASPTTVAAVPSAEITPAVEASATPAPTDVATMTPTMPAATPKATPKPTPKPTARPTSGPSLVLTFSSLTSPINPGSYATAKVKTSPAASCTIVVEYKSGPSTAAGLGPKPASSSGVASWTWKVGSRTSAGSWPVTVTCSKGGQHKSVTKYLKVL